VKVLTSSKLAKWYAQAMTVQEWYMISCTCIGGHTPGLDVLLLPQLWMMGGTAASCHYWLQLQR
jgi:hypothetical protein